MKIEDAENLYYIGGIVRDEILGKKSFDIDLTYIGNAIDFAKQLDDIEILKINEPFGTVKIKYKGNEIDIASTRAEIYEKDGHLPTVTRIGCSLKEDVLRRDFTINSLAKNYNSGEIIDYTGGLNDIKNRIIKVLHNKSFIEDPTRIIRALKFAVRFNFELEHETKILRDKYLENINYDMSYKRIKKELIETFNLNFQNAYDEFISAKIYKLVTKHEIKKPNVNIQNFINKYANLINPQNIWLIYIGTLDEISNLEATLTKEEKRIITDYKSLKNTALNTDFEIYQAFINCNTETILLYGIMCNKDTAEHYLNDLRHINLSINGQDLKTMGINPSPKYQECFNFILKNKLNEKTLTREQELNLAKKFFGI